MSKLHPCGRLVIGMCGPGSTAGLAVLVTALLAPAARAINYNWNNAGGGDYGTDLNWTPTSPVGGPTSSDGAYFQVSGSPTYTVDIPGANAFAASSNVTGGNDVTFNLQGNAYLAGALNVGGATLSSATIKGPGTAALADNGNLNIGLASIGSLTISDAAVVDGGTTNGYSIAMARDPGSQAFLTVTGSGSILNTNSLDASNGTGGPDTGQSIINIQNSGKMTITGSTNSFLNSKNAAGPSSLTVSSGGEFDFQPSGGGGFVVGSGASGLGAMTITGTSSLAKIKLLQLGNAGAGLGVGTLTVRSGGVLKLGGAASGLGALDSENAASLITGDGTIMPATTATSYFELINRGIVKPGNGVDGQRTMTLIDLDVMQNASGSTFRSTLNGTATSQYDRLVVIDDANHVVGTDYVYFDTGSGVEITAPASGLAIGNTFDLVTIPIHATYGGFFINNVHQTSGLVSTSVVSLTFAGPYASQYTGFLSIVNLLDGTQSLQLQLTEVPEPASLSLLMIGAGLILRRNKRK